MSTAFLESPYSGTPLPLLGQRWATAAEMIEHFGGIPASRIRMWPLPGTATVDDVRRQAAAGEKACELIDGTLVDKPMAYYESRIASVLGYFIEDYLTASPLGLTTGEQGMSEILPDLVRIPDLAFVRWSKLPGRVCPQNPVPKVAPDLAVEVLSESNTLSEMERKRADYFLAGTQLVWEVDPETRSVRVYTAPDSFTTLKHSDTLSGGDVLPGFSLEIAKWFTRALGPGT